MANHKKLFFLILILNTLLACNKDKMEDDLDGDSIGETKQINWELIHTFDSEDGSVINFDISDDGTLLFYANSQKEIFRYNLISNQKDKLYGDLNAMGTSYVHLIDNTLYTITLNDNKSFFGISNDFGDNITQNYVATWIPFEAHNSFLFVEMNRLYKMPDGSLIIPDAISGNADGFAISNDGGLTWSRKVSELKFIHAQKGNRLFALRGGWEGDFGIGDNSELSYSDNQGTSWQKADLTFYPQATDREGNLIACNTMQIQKLKNGKWTLYEWDGNFPYTTSLQNENFQGSIVQRYEDIEFDAANNLYIISGLEGTTGSGLYKTRLD